MLGLKLKENVHLETQEGDERWY